MFFNVNRLKENMDWELLLLVLSISLAGVLAIYSASQNYDVAHNYHYKQLLWIFFGFIVLLCVVMVDFEWILRFAYVYHALVVVLLVLVLLYGEGNRSSDVKRWLNLGVGYVQPSEFAKITLVLALGKYFNNSKIGTLHWYDILVGVVFTFVPFFLIFKQPDFGTALFLPIIFISIIFMMGLNYKVLLATTVVGIMSIPLIWLGLKSYQQDRVLMMFNPESDPLGKGYHLIQSKIAIGSGSVFGKGFLQGKQAQLNFLPAKHTDFIFSLFNEEWGFVGGIVLIALYYAFILKCLSYLKSQNNPTGIVVTVGVTSIFSAHIVINLSMVMGMLPVVGVTLPFFSYGGSSILSMMLGLGIMLSCLKNNPA